MLSQSFHSFSGKRPFFLKKLNLMYFVNTWDVWYQVKKFYSFIPCWWQIIFFPIVLFILMSRFFIWAVVTSFLYSSHIPLITVSRQTVHKNKLYLINQYWDIDLLGKSCFFLPGWFCDVVSEIFGWLYFSSLSIEDILVCDTNKFFSC